MWFIVVGLIALGLKLTGYTVVAGLDWVWILSPFAAAGAWWMISDTFGFTQRAQMKKMERRKEDRRQRQVANLEFKDRRRGARRRSEKAFEGVLTRPASTIIPEQSAPKNPKE